MSTAEVQQSDLELAALYGVSNGRFELENAGAERMVGRRYWLVTVCLVLGTLAFGVIALTEPITGHPVTNWSLYLVVVIVVGGGIGLPMGYGMGRSMTGLFVPKAISLGRDCLVADFRREGWPPPRIKRMRFKDVRALRLSPLLRVPQVSGTVEDPRPGAHSFYFYFFLDPIVFAATRGAYRSWRESDVDIGQAINSERSDDFPGPPL